MSSLDILGSETVTPQPAAPLGPSQERAGALREAGLSPCVQVVLSFAGRVCTRDLRQAIEQVLARHAVLRGPHGAGDAMKWTMSALSAAPARARGHGRERRVADGRPARPPSSEQGPWV